MQNIIINLIEGVTGLRTHKLRSLLAILGVVIGVAAVIAVVSFGEGHSRRIQEEIDKIGADVFWVQPKSQSRYVEVFAGGMISVVRQEEGEAKKPRHLTCDHVETLRRYGTRIEQSTPFFYFQEALLLNDDQVSLEIIATDPSYEEIMDLDIVRGRFINETDVREKRRVCVIKYSDYLRKYLTKKEPLQSFVQVKNVKYRVVGLLSKSSKGIRGSRRGSIFIPISTLKYINAWDSLDNIYCKAKKGDMKKAIEQAETVLTSKEQGVNAFDCVNVQRMFESAEKLNRTASLVTGGIAMISLIVGSIGIMNIMLVSVTERTREIGTRKCVGAKKRDILSQFLLESILLTSIGGAVGIGLGIFLANFIASLIKIPSVISFFSIAIGFLFSVGIGIISGFYPAFKASKLNPIEALRYE